MYGDLAWDLVRLLVLRYLRSQRVKHQAKTLTHARASQGQNRQAKHCDTC